VDHVVYLDAKAGELEKLLDKRKSMIIRGAMGRKLPYGRVNVGDVLYFINNNAEGKIRAKGHVCFVFNSEKMDRAQSNALIEKNQNKLELTVKQLKRWGGKRYLVLIEVADVKEIEPFRFVKSNFATMDDWLMVENIDSVKV
jgi:hypothetical protein